MDTLGPHNAFWIDGEWLSWDDIPDDAEDGEYSCELERLEYEAQIRWDFPGANVADVECFRDLLELAKRYHRQTTRHLNVYGDIGELYGAIKFGIKLHQAYAQGSDGRMGNDFVEIKTISPMSRSDSKSISLKGHFSKVLLVKIDDSFQVRGKFLNRRDLGNCKKNAKIVWSDGRAAD